jgi:hypothetical protein
VVLGHPSRSALSTPPITSSGTSTQPTTRHRRRGSTVRERHDVEAGRRRGWLPSAARHRPHGTALQSCTRTSPLLRAKTQLTVHISTNDLHCWKPAHSWRRAETGGRPRRHLPRRRNPPRHAPRQQQQDGGKTDILTYACVLSLVSSVAIYCCWSQGLSLAMSCQYPFLPILQSFSTCNSLSQCLALLC